VKHVTFSRAALPLFFLALAIPSPTSAWAAGDDAAAPLIVTADFNHDGIADFARVTLPGSGRGDAYLTILLGQKDKTLRVANSRPAVGNDPTAMVVGDFNGDGNPDVIVADANGTLRELLGDGLGGLVPVGEVAHFDSVTSIVLGDFEHNGRLDLAVMDPDANSVTILSGAGDGAFHVSWSFPLPMRGKSYGLVTADFNRDGIPDLAVTNEDDGTFAVMVGSGNGTFTYDPALSKEVDPNEHCPS